MYLYTILFHLQKNAQVSRTKSIKRGKGFGPGKTEPTLNIIPPQSPLGKGNLLTVSEDQIDGVLILADFAEEGVAVLAGGAGGADGRAQPGPGGAVVVGDPPGVFLDLHPRDDVPVGPDLSAGTVQDPLTVQSPVPDAVVILLYADERRMGVLPVLSFGDGDRIVAVEGDGIADGIATVHHRNHVLHIIPGVDDVDDGLQGADLGVDLTAEGFQLRDAGLMVIQLVPNGPMAGSEKNDGNKQIRKNTFHDLRKNAFLPNNHRLSSRYMMLQDHSPSPPATCVDHQRGSYPDHGLVCTAFRLPFSAYILQ